ncbi:uncharacterized protein LOC129592829 [Paramacrobiotus metropolitanus]|uniref:uncharacterized protein LOC129592829 n=1 Tax=Paramacrobiotus metropolitanus TaxID=2943436 RepID=UPI00244643FC|nr:uncharacterized protein LOC129592829 [Paramacrobiotus metropolitanus]
MRQAFEEFEDRVEYIQNLGYSVTVMWSCEWLQKRLDPVIDQFVSSQNYREPLNPRAAFKGGRTNASRLHYSVKNDEKILHYDVVSLYPCVNKKKEYPYYGLVYCKVLPPDECLFPVLPSTIKGKLIFTLCRACATAKATTFCKHSDEERCLEGVWVTVELHHALDVGYKVITVYEVWHWDTKEAGLFAKYMDLFLKVKMEASGWPNWCNTPEKRAAFVQLVKEREGIDLDPDAMNFDAGQKTAAKVALNGLWGKTAQKDDDCSTEFVHNPKRYVDLCRSKAVEIHDVFAVNEECLMVTHAKADEYNEGNNTTNVAIAAFTTAHARLILLALMEKLGERLLYFDTDSVIFVQRPGDWLPETGSVLGDWDNQLEAGESHIVEFVSCGPKVYSYKTDTGRTELKVKGMMQNGFSENILDWDEITETFKRSGRTLDFDQLKRILDGTDPHVQILYPEFIRRNAKTQEICTLCLEAAAAGVFGHSPAGPVFRHMPYFFACQRDNIPGSPLPCQWQRQRHLPAPGFTPCRSGSDHQDNQHNVISPSNTQMQKTAKSNSTMILFIDTPGARDKGGDADK